MELVTNLRDNCPVNKQNKTGELVRTLRLALGLSQEKLAERSGGELDASYVGKIERGSNKASTLKVRRALAAANLARGASPDPLGVHRRRIAAVIRPAVLATLLLTDEEEASAIADREVRAFMRAVASGAAMPEKLLDYVK